MKIKAFYEKENLFLQSPMSDVQSPESAFCPLSNVYCLMSDFSDYMHFRYYASTMGRFLKPDNIIPNAFNPQSWNLYSYVNGNPVNFNDPSGHDLRGKQGKMGMHQALMGVGGVSLPLAAEYGGFWENPSMAMPAIDAVCMFKATGYSAIGSLMVMGYFDGILVSGGKSSYGSSWKIAPFDTTIAEYLQGQAEQAGTEVVASVFKVSETLTAFYWATDPANIQIVNLAHLITLLDVMYAGWRYSASPTNWQWTYYLHVHQAEYSTPGGKEGYFVQDAKYGRVLQTAPWHQSPGPGPQDLPTYQKLSPSIPTNVSMGLIDSRLIYLEFIR